MPLIPKHIFQDVKRENLPNTEQNYNPVGTGPYMLGNWEKNQSITLKGNKNSFLYNEYMISEIIFKIVPDYNARIIQLKSSELDLVEEIEPKDVNELHAVEHLQITPQKGRAYDYVGWNNIDPKNFVENKKISSHKFFGNPNIRKALTLAINRELILEEYLRNYGKLAVGPIAPIFRTAINPDLKAYPYDPERAKIILQKEGWKDSDLNGILDKDGVDFSFTLNIPGGNPLRIYTSTIIKDNLKKVGIEVQIESHEPQVFWDKVFGKGFDAWVAGWSVPIPLDLKTFWHSDLETNFANVASYQNKKADLLLDKMSTQQDKGELNKYYKEFQTILYNDNPVTFLFWIDNLVAHNNKIKGININPLGVVQKCWKWSISK